MARGALGSRSKTSCSRCRAVSPCSGQLIRAHWRSSSASSAASSAASLEPFAGSLPPSCCNAPHQVNTRRRSSRRGSDPTGRVCHQRASASGRQRGSAAASWLLNRLARDCSLAPLRTPLRLRSTTTRPSRACQVGSLSSSSTERSTPIRAQLRATFSARCSQVWASPPLRLPQAVRHRSRARSGCRSCQACQPAQALVLKSRLLRLPSSGWPAGSAASRRFTTHSRPWA